MVSGSNGSGDLGVSLELRVVVQVRDFGGNSDVHRLVGDGLLGAIDLDLLDDVGLSANLLQGLDLAGQGLHFAMQALAHLLQRTELYQLLLIISHSFFLLKM